MVLRTRPRKSVPTTDSKIKKKTRGSGLFKLLIKRTVHSTTIENKVKPCDETVGDDGEFLDFSARGFFEIHYDYFLSDGEAETYQTERARNAEFMKSANRQHNVCLLYTSRCV